jgi:Ca2+/H+ antiporter
MFTLTVLFVIYLVVVWINISYHEDNYSKHSDLTRTVSIHIRRDSFLWPIKLTIYLLVMLVLSINTLTELVTQSK